MLRPTANPIKALADTLESVQQKADTALTSGGTQVAQAVRKLQKQVKKIALVQQQMADLIARMPQVQTRKDVRTGFGVTGTGWVTIASVTIPRLDELNRVVVSASGQANILDSKTGGITSSQCRIVIGGQASAVIQASKDAGASMVNNVLSVSDVREISPMTGAVTIDLQAQALNSEAFAAYPSNLANLTVYAGYSRV